MKKIVHFAGTLKKEDGVTSIILALIREAKKVDIESIIITGFAEDESITSAPIVQIPSITFPLYKEYKITLPGINSFAKKLDEFKPDIIHIHSPDIIAWIALRYAKSRNIPIVATYHTNFDKYLGYYHLSLLKPLVWYLLIKLYKKMKLVTTPSQTVSDELIKRGIPSKNIITIPWGVDRSRFSNSFKSESWRKNITNGKNKTILLYVGRLTWEKDFKTLIEIYNLLRNKRNDFTMVIAGDGPIRKELEKSMPEVKFLGYINGKELSTVYASCDILFFPSSTETFGNVSMEAISSGIIPILANTGGIKTLIENEKIGLICESKNPQDFFVKIDKLLDNKELQKIMRVNGSNFIKNFTWDKVFNQILQVYMKSMFNKNL
jgi:glycosyltransferase involved in cell wall biosynthesis